MMNSISLSESLPVRRRLRPVDINCKAYPFCSDSISILRYKLAFSLHYVEVQNYLNNVNKPFNCFRSQSSKTFAKSSIQQYKAVMDVFMRGDPIRWF